MEIWEAALLGIIQGLTEFLPVSSSGHLVLGEYLLGIQEGGRTTVIILHTGSLVAVFVALWYRIWPVITGTVAGTLELLKGRFPQENEGFRWGLYVIIGTIPAGLVGVFLGDYVDAALGNPMLAAVMLIVTGILLMSSHFVSEGKKDMGWISTVIVGISQAFAILPGISRSGSTIVTALWMKVDRTKAAEYSFLLSIPAILGGAVIEVARLVFGSESAVSANAQTAVDPSLLPLLIGFICAAVSGYFAIVILLDFVKRGKLSWFAYYCWAVGITGIVLL